MVCPGSYAPSELYVWISEPCNLSIEKGQGHAAMAPVLALPRRWVPNLTPGKHQKRLQTQHCQAWAYLHFSDRLSTNRTIWKHLESDICFVMFWLLQKAFNKRKSVCIAIVAGRFRLGTVDRDILKVQVQIHDATVICVRASHESSSSQQPTGRQPNPPRPSKRMCVVWLLWRLIIKSMHSGPKAGSFIPKRSMANWQLLEVFCVTNSKHGQVSILLKYSPSRLEDNRTQIYSRH